MKQIHRSITLDYVTDTWIRNNIENFSNFVRERVADEQALQETLRINKNEITVEPNPFKRGMRMFERHRTISQHISMRWKAEEATYRMGLAGRWKKWQKKEQDVDAGLIPCSDHLGFYRDGNQIVATIEPYSYSMGCTKKLIEYCESRGLTFVIDASSSHAPGACIRIRIYESRR